MQKKCLSCGIQFTLSGSGKRQKYCSNCSSRGVHQGRGLPASNALKTKAAKHASVRQQVEAQKHLPNPISFTAPEGHRGRVWLASDRNGKKLIGDDRHWRVHVSEAIKRAEAKKRRASIFDKPVDLMNGRQRANIGRELRQAILDTELAPPLKGFPVVLCFQDEALAIGSGQRLVLCQFRGKRVILHGGGYTATIKRDTFKALVAANKRYRKRNHVRPPALLPHQEEVRARPPKPEAYQPEFTEVLKGDDITIGTYPDGYPIMPACLRREPLLKLVVNNLPADTSKDEAA